VTSDSARQNELEERVRVITRRLGLEPRSLPLPPEDAPTPARPWCDTDRDESDPET
jgi:hypothetical protein